MNTDNSKTLKIGTEMTVVHLDASGHAEAPAEQPVTRFMVYVSMSGTGLVGSIEPERDNEHHGKISNIEQSALLLKEINMNQMLHVMVQLDGWHMFLFIEPSEVRRWSRMIYGQNEPQYLTF